MLKCVGLIVVTGLSVIFLTIVGHSRTLPQTGWPRDAKGSGVLSYFNQASACQV